MHNFKSLSPFWRNIKRLEQFNIRLNSTYVQGQSPEPKIREYFYFINHEGMLFLDDARMKNFTSCFKDKKFLEFFFKRLKINDTNRYQTEFQYLSLCGRERNFIRCDDLPIVFTHIIPSTDPSKEFITYAYAGDSLKVDFEPDKIYMAPSGKVYHPAPERYGSIGLIRSKLAIELSKHFEFELGEENAPNAINWNGELHKIDDSWLSKAVVFKSL
uniref:CSON012386 protein n=1 Tax=Culicoides sonorensis TaxID=179676 RepID=A0A336M9L3_CULSO